MPQSDCLQGQVATKRCGGCGIDKPRSEFSPRKKGGTVLVSRCRPCSAKTSREWYHANTDKVREYQKRTFRDRHLKSRYGISESRYEEMYREQHGRCAICHEPHDRLAVDHCHSTGKVGGLLCDPCNHGLGRFRDDPDLLLNALGYLRKHR